MTSPADYHEQTKHHFHRYANSAGYMDWDNQPVPFRWYSGSPAIDLPLLRKEIPGDFNTLYSGLVESSLELTLDPVAAILELSLGLSAWKSYGDARWSLRINPSSGNLHPTEAHLFLPALSDHPAGVYHYNPYLHQLERRREFSTPLSESLFSTIPHSGFYVLLSSIHWREAWKYGERAFRYCQHDVGHAIAAITFAARLIGWNTQVVLNPDDDGLDKLTGFDKVQWPEMDHESSDVMLCIHNSSEEADGQPGSVTELRRGERGSRPSTEAPLTIPDALIESIANLPVVGTPNPLSATHLDWGIEDVALAARRSNAPIPSVQFHHPVPHSGKRDGGSPFQFPHSVRPTAEQLIRTRRSAQAFDPAGHMPAAVFYDLLDRTLPRQHCAPFDIGAFPTEVNLFLFVHTVDECDPGLYCLVRDTQHLIPLQRACSSQFEWKQVLPDLPLYLLRKGNYRREAMTLSCQQDIAGDSCFSLGMVARFEEVVSQEPWRYRHLFWESGMIGQSLYLGAQAHGFMGTGIGCYVDDPVHETLGMKTRAFQSMYHFTIGVPLIDTRLATTPPYEHLEKARKSAQR